MGFCRLFSSCKKTLNSSLTLPLRAEFRFPPREKLLWEKLLFISRIHEVVTTYREIEMNNPLDLEHVVASTREILAQLLVMDANDIEENSSIVEDLGADSLDIVDLSFQLGRQYGCTLPKTSVLDHALTVCGDASEFLANGRITESGKRLLEQSLSAYTPDQLKAGMQPAQVFAATTVRNWANQCRNLFNYLPATCPDCNAHQAVLNERQQVVCGACSARLVPADGDEVSRQLVEQFVATHAKEAV